MRKLLCLVCACFFAMALCGCASSTAQSTANNTSENKEKASVVAIYLGDNKQPLGDGEGTTIDTIWIYYSDGTFEQYSELDDETELFSYGDYSITGSGFESDGADDTVLTIHRTHKYLYGKGLTEYDSTHDYKVGSLGSLGFYRIFPK